jgi:hydrogenase maturation protein HypF
LLLARAPGFPEALVMTSGNLSEEPIAHTNEAARERLAALADVPSCSTTATSTPAATIR